MLRWIFYKYATNGKASPLTSSQYLSQMRGEPALEGTGFPIKVASLGKITKTEKATNLSREARTSMGGGGCIWSNNTSDDTSQTTFFVCHVQQKHALYEPGIELKMCQKINSWNQDMIQRGGGGGGGNFVGMA